MLARSIKPQKMIAQQGQFFVLAERPYVYFWHANRLDFCDAL